MITFLISNDFTQCARILDPERLNRQIQDCCRIATCLKAYELIEKMNNGKIPFGILFPRVIQLWLSAPSSFLYIHSNGQIESKKIGSGQLLIDELYYYFICMCDEWEKIRGKEHQLYSFDWTKFGYSEKKKRFLLRWPEEVYLFHQSKLLEKDYGYYSQKFKQEKIKHNGTGFKSSWERPKCI